MNIRSLLAGILVWAPLAAAATPEIGNRIPDFEFQGEGGILHRRSEAIGSRGVVIAWFPKAFTPG